MAVHVLANYRELYEDAMAELKLLQIANVKLFESLRDEFALKILPTLMMRYNDPGYSDIDAITEAYRIAENMIEFRENNRPPLP